MIKDPDLISRIEDADDLEEDDRSRCELYDLPGLTGFPAPVHNHLPVAPVDRGVDVVAVGPVVAVPQQQSGMWVRVG